MVSDFLIVKFFGNVISGGIFTAETFNLFHMMPKLLRILLLFWSVSLGQLAAGQTLHKPAPKPCGTPVITPEYLSAHPAVKKRLAAIEAHTQRYIEQAGSAAEAAPIGPPPPLLVIPVVVHVVYNTSAQNLSDGVIQSQIDVLNQAFRGSLSSGPSGASMPAPFASLVGDARISFCLATRKPDGSSTNGITRRNNTNDPYYGNRQLDYDEVRSANSGGVDAWNTTEYLNIWVCDLAAGFFGYAEFPGASTLAKDGVVMNYTAFGQVHAALHPRYTLGRIAVHEIGHWLNLQHIWADDPTAACAGSDLVSDTPNQADANVFNPTFPHVTCNNGPDGDMFVSHMDYVDDDSRLMFSKGQALRMQAIFASGGARESLKSSPGLRPVLGIGSATIIPGTVFCGDQTGIKLRAVPASVGCAGGTLQYQWAATNGWTVNSPAGYSPTFTPNGTSGTTITLTGTYINGNGVSFPLNTASVVIGFTPSLATPVFQSPSISLCAGTNYPFSVASVAGAGSYRWTVPAGFTPTGQVTTPTPNLTITPNASLVGGVYSLTCQAQSSNCASSAVATCSFIANGGPQMKIVNSDPSQNYGGVVCQRNRIFLELVPVTPTPPGITWSSYTNIQWSPGALNQPTNGVPSFPLRASYYTPDALNATFTVTATYYDACGVQQPAVPYNAKTPLTGSTSLGNGYSCTTYPWRPAPSAPYPNPATGTLQLPGYYGTVMVYNQLGKPVQQSLAPGTNDGATVDTSAWPDGLYVITGRNQLGEFLRHNVQIQH